MIWLLVDKRFDLGQLDQKLPLIFDNFNYIIFTSQTTLIEQIDKIKINEQIKPLICDETQFKNLNTILDYFNNKFFRDFSQSIFHKETIIESDIKFKLIEFSKESQNTINTSQYKTNSEIMFSGLNVEVIKLLNLNLTKRELDFLTLYVKNQSIREVAHKMFLSIKGVEYYRRSVYEKTGVKSKSELLIFAIQNGIAQVDFL